MSGPNFMILYVENAQKSGAFYSTLLGRAPVDASPAFVMFALDSGMRLGLWTRDTVLPAPAVKAGGAEIGIPVGSPAAIDATHAEWKARGIAIAQEPTDMDFGRTFVGLDPDGHRLRVFAPA
jgi:catechol 2,3-dioxygenase-like lactoylglutathione lyase family enzyme